MIDNIRYIGSDKIFGKMYYAIEFKIYLFRTLFCLSVVKFIG